METINEKVSEKKEIKGSWGMIIIIGLLIAVMVVAKFVLNYIQH